ncbi:MAG TPA: SusC/RagA family TonB-linked outer membrane protein [Bacteroidales bacterium]|nr:SusC/RagA family TonB-linked outer membrane protein [Bacteroidales bacterium]
MKKLLLLAVLSVLVSGYALLGQTNLITGTVTSGVEGEGPIPGVAVSAKGTTVGALTDLNGKYSLQVPQNVTTLVFSYIGMKKQEVEIGGRSVIDVVLEPDITGLDEVVVTALGISREKKSLGYATQQIGGEAVSKIQTNNFVNSLSGKISGVNIRQNNNMGGSTNVIIRGAKSLTGSNQALFVVDGVPIDNSNINNAGQLSGRSGYDYGNTASDINPNDIESIDVLKGAAASALYGSRAANGVIMITTKKGAARTGKGIGVTFNSNVTFGTVDKSTFPKYQQSYGGGYGPFYSEGDHPGLEEFVDVNGDGTPDLTIPFYEDASMGEKFDPNLMVYHWDAFIPESPNYLQAKPFVPSPNGPLSFFNTSRSLTNTFDISGGNELATFRFSYTNLDQTSIMPNSSLKRNNFVFNGSYNMLKTLKLTASANYVNTTGRGRNSTGYSDNILTSFRQWYQVDTDVKMLKDLFEKTNRNITWNPKGFNSEGVFDPTPNYWDNPYWVRFRNYETDERNRIIGFTQADWSATPWLSFMGRAAIDTYSELTEERKAVGSVSGEFGVGRPDVTSGYSRLTRTFLETNIDFMATFKKDITEDLNISALLGTNIRRRRIDQVYASTNNGLSVPDVYALSNSVDPMLPPEETAPKIGVNGYYASASLGFRDMFYLDGTWRIDQSSTLPKNNWTYNYPSISGSFIFSQLVDAPWLDLGKLRLNYAEVGNDAPFASVTDVYVPVAPFSGVSMASVSSTKNNPSLKPERTKSIEGGLEINILQSRLGLDLALYKSNTINQILPVSVSFATGYSAKFVNAGELENKGVELRFTGVPVRIGGFDWTLTINWARNRNKVVALQEGIENLQIAALQGGVTINARVGEPYGAIQGTDYVYQNGKRVVLPTGYYQLSPTSDIVLGNINPDWTGGLQNTFRFKDLSLSFLLDMQQGGDIFSLDLWYGMATGLYQETVYTNDLGNPVRDPVIPIRDPGTGAITGYDPASGGVVLDGVLADGTPNTRRVPGNDYRVFGYARNPNRAFVYDASFVKLREVSLTYNFPRTLLANTFIGGASLSFIGSNLWIIHKNLPHADPEASQSAGNIQGWQSGVMPSTRNFGFSLNLQF